MPQSLSPLFRPRSVAVVGVSRDKGTLGFELLKNLLRGEFTGAVYPVTSHSPVVQGMRTWPSVTAIPDPVDLAILVVPAAQVLEAVDDCGRKGVKALVVASGGFAETGAAGRLLEDALRERIKHHGMRMVGPNCLGLVNAHPSIHLNATVAPTAPPFGNISFASQSGALGLAVLDEARELGLGISQFVSLGNRADVSGNDLLELWEEDPATQVILLYLESLGNPRRFMDIARRVSRQKPIVMVKAGRTAAGERAANSHTGALASTEVAMEALLAQAGILRTDTIHELFDVAGLLSMQPVPKGRRVAIVTNAGGPGIMATDACVSRGLEVAPLEEQTQRVLRELLPAEAATLNPVDLTAEASAATYARALRQVLDDPTVDVAVVLFVTPIGTEARGVADAIIAAVERRKKPIVTCMMGRGGVQEAVTHLRSHKIPVFDFPESAAAAVAKAASYGAWLAAPEGHLVEPAGFDVERVQRLVHKGLGERRSHWLSAPEVAELFDAAGIRQVRALEADGAEAAVEAARALGFPVVVKGRSETIAHLAELGAVVSGVESVQGVRDAVAHITARVAARGRESELQGLVVQRQPAGGVQTTIVASRDARCGPLVSFGLSGVPFEVLKDVASRLAPLRDSDAEYLLTAIKGRPLLEGFRGLGKVDRGALVDLLLRVSRLAYVCPEVHEILIDPAVASHDGVAVTSARVRLERSPAAYRPDPGPH